MKHIEIIDGKVYSKEATKALEKRRDELIANITQDNVELADIKSKIVVQVNQKAAIKAKKAVTDELTELGTEHNPDDSMATLEAKLPPKPEPTPVEDLAI